MSADPAPQLPAPDPAAVLAELRPALVRFFRRRRTAPGEAEDLAQDVIVSTLARSNWASHEQAKGYVFRAAINRWRDRRRRQISHGTQIEWNEESARATGEAISPERVLMVEDELLRVVAALQELSERTRDIFMLHRLEHMTYPQIARSLSISVSAVEKHVIKALAHLSGRIEDHDPV
jgi:RNA polymerase sigma factor (sigma-70 family)